MNGTTAFGANREQPRCAVTRCPYVDNVANRRMAWVMAAVARRSLARLLRGPFAGHATNNRKRPVEAAGAVDAKNAPTAPWKTAQNAVSHSYHRLVLLS